MSWIKYFTNRIWRLLIDVFSTFSVLLVTKNSILTKRPFTNFVFLGGRNVVSLKKVTLDVTRVVNAIDKTKKHQLKKLTNIIFFSF